jgi:hypothetical protein
VRFALQPDPHLYHNAVDVNRRVHPLIRWLLTLGAMTSLGLPDFVIGVPGSFTNGLGAWRLFASLDAGAQASVAVPLTALNQTRR